MLRYLLEIFSGRICGLGGVLSCGSGDHQAPPIHCYCAFNDAIQFVLLGLIEIQFGWTEASQESCLGDIIVNELITLGV
jgi:hypothetical protein